MDIFALLALAKSKGASDLHMVVSRPPLLRIDGRMMPVDDVPSLTNEDIEQAFSQITSEQERAEFDRKPGIRHSGCTRDCEFCEGLL